RHAGDFGNLVADATGRAHKVITVENITIAGTRNPIVGRGVIVHAKMDDGGQPTGNAGARIAQGVIGIAKTP
ncbi:MAG: superoxide dismutase family protein, partial [Phycisphaerales bacterium]|nr:superoxide dismutase family protein [Phycisphaerales bacterium]